MPRTNRQMRNSRRAGIRAVLLSLVMLFVSGIVVLSSSTSAQADSNVSSNVAVRGAQTWYVYAKAGETVNVDFSNAAAGGKDGNFPSGNTWGNTSNVIVTSPNGQTTTHTFTYNNVTSDKWAQSFQATSDGVWSVSLTKTTQSTSNLGKVPLYWSIGVSNGRQSITGRVWTEKYVVTGMKQADLNLWYETEAGFLYKISRNGFMGIDSTFTANAFGTVHKGGADDCTSAYTSFTTVNSSDTDSYAYPGYCSGFTAYKIFFAEPSSDLPASVTLPGGTHTWLKNKTPDPALYRIASLSFDPDAPGSRSGRVNFTVGPDDQHYEGNATVYIDVNNNGSYNDAVDRQLGVAVIDGKASFEFDGKDANGNSIPSTTPLSVKVTLSKVGEVHFSDDDVEQESGGQEVTRIGDAFGDENLLYWDDSRLDNSGRCSQPQQLSSGSAGVDSTGGVAGWSACSSGGTNANDGVHGSYGDVRFIDRWTYVKLDVQRQLEIPAMKLAKTADPPTGTKLSAGDTVHYKVTVTPIRYAHLDQYDTTNTCPVDDPATSDANKGKACPDLPATSWNGQYTDDLSDVADNATIDWDSLKSSPSEGSTITKDQADNSYTWVSTAVPLASKDDVTPVNTTYDVTVNTQASNSDWLLHNIAYSYITTTPPTTPSDCSTQPTDTCGEAEHPLGKVAIIRLRKLVLTLGKTDVADAQPVSGWDLSASGQNVTAPDTTTTVADGWVASPWSVVFPNETSSAQASLSETNKAGFEFDSLTCTVDGKAISVAVNATKGTGVLSDIKPGNEVACTYVNKVKPGSVSWQKVDGGDTYGTPTYLDGSVWQLTGSGDASSYGAKTDITDCVESSADACTGVDKNPAAGKFTVDQLPQGDYTLKETQAPVGFELSNKEYTVTISADDLDVSFGDITNVRSDVPDLPLTGGIGTDQIWIAAGVITTLMLGAYVWRRRSAR